MALMIHPRRFALLVLLASTLCPAQSSPWQGEWGAFTDPAATNGQRLTLSNCTAESCSLEIEVAGSGQRCDVLTHASVSLLSSTEAVATLPGEDKTQTCKLQLHREQTPGKPSITVAGTSKTCTSYYCTSAAVTFNHTFPQRSTGIYSGQHINQCFLDNSPAALATCTDPTLAALEQKWQDLYFEFPLETKNSKEDQGYHLAKQADVAILRQCDSQPQPAACVQTKFSADISVMTAKQQAFIQGYSERGDPTEASRIATTIAGRYRHKFPNGDVQGDTFTSTDTLILTPVSKNSIHFDAHLEFYNGHECNLAGGALFRKDGTFVFDDDPSNALPPAPVCKLAIIPTNTGVKFRDLTGGCKNYCGERGGWNGEGFLFTDRISAPAKPASPKSP
jgi:hypothetical protein